MLMDASELSSLRWLTSMKVPMEGLLIESPSGSTSTTPASTPNASFSEHDSNHGSPYLAVPSRRRKLKFTEKYRKPNCSYSCLIGMAMKASGRKSLPVCAIYKFIEWVNKLTIVTIIFIMAEMSTHITRLLQMDGRYHLWSSNNSRVVNNSLQFSLKISSSTLVPFLITELNQTQLIIKQSIQEGGTTWGYEERLSMGLKPITWSILGEWDE